MRDLPKLHALIKQIDKVRISGRLLSVDPGETSGVTVLDINTEGTYLLTQNQLQCWPLEHAVHSLTQLLHNWQPFRIVYEHYHIYKWRLQEHSFSEVPTLQIIGALRTLAIQRGIPVFRQTAQQGKNFFTDAKLRALDMFFEGQPHARDSLRHAAHFVTFGPSQKEPEPDHGPEPADQS